MDIDRHGGGWRPDLPDHRDFTVDHRGVRKWLRRLPLEPDHRGLPPTVDWREYCAPAVAQGRLPTASAHACAALVQYFERRAHGRLIEPSRLFLYANARRLSRGGGGHGVGLRSVLKALVRFGGPPEEYWPYRAAALDRMPPAFAYGFAAEYQKIRFVRIDGPRLSGGETLAMAQIFLAAGFPFAFGFSVSSSLRREDNTITFPTVYDDVRVGAAAVAVGYDDKRRIYSDKGALLIRTSWGSDWGEGGYYWLPYAYVRQRLAVDLWTLLKRSWLRSGEFFRPAGEWLSSS